MLIFTAVALLVSAAPVPSGSLSLASPGFTTVQMDSQLGSFYADHFAQQLTLQGGISVITGSEIQSLLGFERQKQLLGCEDDSSACLAELAGALGVDALITGNLGKVGRRYVVNIKILSSRDGRALSVHSGQLSDEDALLDFLNEAATTAGVNLKRELVGTKQSSDASPSAAAIGSPPEPTAKASAIVEEPSVRASSSSSLSPAVLATGSVGLTAMISGGVLLYLSAGAHQQLVSGDEAIQDLDRHVQQGELFQTLGWAGVGLGAAGLGVAAVLLLTEDEPPVAAALVPIHGGAVAVVEGGLPW